MQVVEGADKGVTHLLASALLSKMLCNTQQAFRATARRLRMASGELGTVGAVEG